MCKGAGGGEQGNRRCSALARGRGSSTHHNLIHPIFVFGILTAARTYSKGDRDGIKRRPA